ncbi:Glycosyl hydrolase family 32, C-terminal [Dillenia turbinata]|uniref:beta-fructofuranosidase n=1 Tax=Dillenia turbinata TaxID=194707 RepID=A0AAN8ZMY6_9MAGN
MAGSPYPDMEDPIVSKQSTYYSPLLENDENSSMARVPTKKLVKGLLVILSVLMFVCLFVSSLMGGGERKEVKESALAAGRSTEIPAQVMSRGVAEGVSEKKFNPKLTGGAEFDWSNEMLSWQKTGFHFQAQKNWLNGPMFYGGWYHLFYQYNPQGAKWGNIVWGHAISRDLVNWRHLPLAMIMDQWYDAKGVWTGSATILSDGKIVMLYTGSTNQSVQVQNLAYPADPSDPLLVKWVKYSGNPVLVPPPGINVKDFRDPTTAWQTSEGKWRIAIGSKVNKTGITLIYETEDFKKFELLDGVLHSVSNTGMWECVDFFPISMVEDNGLENNVIGDGVKHFLKESSDDTRYDYYALGTYDPVKGVWTPDNNEIDVGIGMKVDYGKFYASKTFYDQNKKRRVLWGWMPEADSESSDVKKGWASVMAVPRTILFDKKTGSNVLQWPVEEIESLRTNSTNFNKMEVTPGSVLSLEVGNATQLDITAEFEVDPKAFSAITEVDAAYSCSRGGGAAQRGAAGPFGLLVLADENRSEQTPVYFYVTKGSDGKLKTHFCNDKSRSSLAGDVYKGIEGGVVPVLEGEKFSVRVLVDHSIVDTFAQGGRTCVTSRVYPTRAIFESARVFVFNNATAAKVTASVKIWQMKSAEFTS